MDQRDKVEQDKLTRNKQRLLREKKEAKVAEKQQQDRVRKLEQSVAQLKKEAMKKDKELKVLRSYVNDLRQTVQLLASKILKQ